MQLSQKTEAVPEIDNPLEKHEAGIDMATHYQQPNQAKKNTKPKQCITLLHMHLITTKQDPPRRITFLEIKPTPCRHPQFRPIQPQGTCVKTHPQTPPVENKKMFL
jgi:hypothetical protein